MCVCVWPVSFDERAHGECENSWPPPAGFLAEDHLPAGPPRLSHPHHLHLTHAPNNQAARAWRVLASERASEPSRTRLPPSAARQSATERERERETENPQTDYISQTKAEGKICSNENGLVRLKPVAYLAERKKINTYFILYIFRVLRVHLCRCEIISVSPSATTLVPHTHG